MSLGKVRIIGGYWRGRYIKVIDQVDLRPTADRVRETLFNWLGQHLDGKHCLDMFSGTGVIGLEALSRGAAHVTMLELSKPVYLALKGNIESLGSRGELGDLDLFLADSIQYSSRLPDQSVDICFIDPPFANQAIFLKALQQAVRVTKNDVGSAIYIEHPKDISPADLLGACLNGNLWEIGRTIRSGLATGTLLVPKNE
jgi:16S rRNA (guanine(966)-N(2))-methyltransferase RsmD